MAANDLQKQFIQLIKDKTIVFKNSAATISIDLHYMGLDTSTVQLYAIFSEI